MTRAPFIVPCQPTLHERLPKGETWIYEVKFDGYRLQIHKADGAITLYTRNGADWTDRFPQLASSLTSLPCRSAIIDAELVHVDGFEALHQQLFGPEGYRFRVLDGGVLEPFVGLKAVWDFDKDDTTTVGGFVVGNDAWHGRVETGAILQTPWGMSVRGAAAYDGIGEKNFNVYQGWLLVTVPFN